jgi:hypothetical protein
VITPGYGSWIIILPGYIVAPMASMKAFLSAASRIIILFLPQKETIDLFFSV